VGGVTIGGGAVTVTGPGSLTSGTLYVGVNGGAGTLNVGNGASVSVTGGTNGSFSIGAPGTAPPAPAVLAL
jgi:T5SS/PEP-CTERM-associated repeat protein